MTLAPAYRNWLPIAPDLLFGIVAGVAIVLLVVLFAVVRRRRHARLLQRFGGEYERAVEEYGTEAAAERELRAREQRVEGLHMRTLNDRQRQHVSTRLLKLQAQFVDSPWGAVRGASTLVKSVMREQGYATEAFERQLEDLSVDHSSVIQHYRAAHALSEVNTEGQGATEDLRQAMVHYRAIVEELCEPVPQAAPAWRTARAS